MTAPYIISDVLADDLQQTLISLQDKIESCDGLDLAKPIDREKLNEFNDSLKKHAEYIDVIIKDLNYLS